MAQPTSTEQLAKRLLEHLTLVYGPLLASRDLWKVLGYPSPAAYRQARSRQRVPVSEFEIEGRRGRFALTQDVAIWLAQQRFPALEGLSQDEPVEELLNPETQGNMTGTKQP